MSALLYGVGAVAFVVGAVMVGFGIPINEFSFGNTLIGAGVTAMVGGLIVAGLGAVVSQLQHLNEALMSRPPRPARPADMFEAAAAARSVPAPARVPFPPKPKSEPELHEPPALEPCVEPAAPADMTAEEPQPASSFAPMLRNPEEPPVTVEEEVSLSPPHPMAAVARGPAGPDLTPADADRYEPKLNAPWRPPAPPLPPSRQPPFHFDAMWPAEPKPAKGSAPAEIKPAAEAKPAAPAPRHPEPEMPAQRPASEPRGVAILKSGVVDGMGYTLYVDGSIEAELPQGTLRFSSINELRSHLEKNS
jgi:hypothetical protein